MFPDSDIRLNKAVLLPLIEDFRNRTDIWIGEEADGQIVAFLEDVIAPDAGKLFGRGKDEEEALTELAVRYLLFQRMNTVIDQQTQQQQELEHV